MSYQDSYSQRGSSQNQAPAYSKHQQVNNEMYIVNENSATSVGETGEDTQRMANQIIMKERPFL